MILESDPLREVYQRPFRDRNAIGVTKSLKTDSRPLEKKPGVPLKDLLAAIAVGARDEELFTTLASRLARLNKQITDKERKNHLPGKSCR